MKSKNSGNILGISNFRMTNLILIGITSEKILNRAWQPAWVSGNWDPFFGFSVFLWVNGVGQAVFLVVGRTKLQLSDFDVKWGAYNGFQD